MYPYNREAEGLLSQTEKKTGTEDDVKMRDVAASQQSGSWKRQGIGSTPLGSLEVEQPS